MALNNVSTDLEQKIIKTIRYGNSGKIFENWREKYIFILVWKQRSK